MSLKDARMLAEKGNASCPGHLVIAGPPVAPPDLSNFAGECGFNVGFDAKGKPVISIPDWYRGFHDWAPAWMANTMFSLIRFILNCVGHFIEFAGKLLGCAGGMRDAALLKKFILGPVKRWLGVELKPMERLNDQIINYNCTTELMSAAEANSCYLADTIDYPTWSCHVKAEGYDEREQAPSVWAGRSRPGTLDVLNLFRRNEIPEGDFRQQMRALGWLDDGEIDQFVKAQKAIPTLPDIVRMMVRDAADEDVALTFQYDKDFENKFTGVLKTWAIANGVDFEIAKYYWRAHWEIPSPTQLYTILHRTNPDDPQVPAGLATLESEVKEALEVNDMAPGWVDRMTYISYHPITNSDGMRAYMIRSISDDEFTWVLRRNGYRYADAATLVRYYKKARKLRDVSQAGGMSTRKVVRLYKNNQISRDEARKRLIDLEIDDEVIELALDGAVLESVDETRGRQVKAVQRKFSKWVVSEIDAAAELRRIGLDLDQTNRLLFEWTWLRERGERHLTAAQLCTLVRKGRIDVPTYVNGLQRLGYDSQAVAGLQGLCSEKAEDELKKEVKKHLADQEKAQKEYERRRAARCRKPVDACGEPVPEPQPPEGGGGSGPGHCTFSTVLTPIDEAGPDCVKINDESACCPPGDNGGAK